jgi:hypothetical protein
MNKPENFRKIDDKRFNTPSGYEYKFSTDGRSPELWVFRQPDTTSYVLAFIINWETERYEVKRAVNGKGTDWIDTLHSGNFGKGAMKTMNSFVEWITYRVAMWEEKYNEY